MHALNTPSSPQVNARMADYFIINKEDSATQENIDKLTHRYERGWRTIPFEYVIVANMVICIRLFWPHILGTIITGCSRPSVLVCLQIPLYAKQVYDQYPRYN